MKHLNKLILTAIAIIVAIPQTLAVGWPSGFEGVMLQGFYWDSYQTETKWSKLEAQADELSESFKLIWVPNSGKSQGGLGYHPIYWFTNHNSDMGSETQLLSMIEAFSERGTGIIADVVINHRSGRTNWTDFPSEAWNGTNWKIGLDGICCDDEVASQAGQGTPTGAYDTGDKYDGARDLDHTNATVQNNCKNYMKCLLDKYHYAGFRLDYSKGYKGQYVKTYNQYAKPTYCVGEYWDGSYDALASWIESTGRESAAFDFAFKYALNNAFSSGDMTQLCWLADGKPQPAGLIHNYYQQLSVTFIDNHDTYRDSNKFPGNVPAANAFMICSPGTPCVFLPHWNQYKSEIKAMIAVRNAVGVTNTSTVNVLRTTYDCYMAEVTGKRGKLVVKVGPAMVSPDGYSDSDIRAVGTDYCIWSKTATDYEPTPTVPSKLYVLGNLSTGSWTTNKGIAFTADGTTFTAKDVTLVSAGATDANAYFTFVTTLGSSWDAVNTADRYGAASTDQSITAGSTATVVRYAGDSASGAKSWKIAAGTYDFTVDFKKMTLTVKESGDDGNVVKPEPSNMVVYWDNSSAKWSTPYVYYWGGTSNATWPGVKMQSVSSTVWQYTVPAGTTNVIFDKGESTGVVGTNQTADLVAMHQHIYNMNGDKGIYTPAVDPTNIYMYGPDATAQPGSTVSLPISLKNSSAITGFQLDLQLPEGVSVATLSNGTPDAALSSRATASHSISSRVLANGDLRISAYSTSNAAFKNSDGELVVVKLQMPDKDGCYIFTGTNITLTDANVVEYTAAGFETCVTLQSAVIKGDANGDGIVSIADAVMIVSHILGSTPENFVAKAADVNGDGTVSMADVVATVTILLGTVAP